MCTMRGRVQIWLAVAICLAIFVTFLAHKPACSSSDMLHNKPVARFKALSADTYAKSGIGTLVQFAVARVMAAPVAPQLEMPATGSDVVTLEDFGPQVLSCCLLC